MKDKKKMTGGEFNVKIRILGALFGQGIPANIEYDTKEMPDEMRADKSAPTLGDMLSSDKKGSKIFAWGLVIFILAMFGCFGLLFWGGNIYEIISAFR